MCAHAGAATHATSSRKDHRQSNPTPSRASRPSAERRLLFRVQDALRPLQRSRVAKCGRVRIGSLVAIKRSTTSGRAHFGGLLRCGSLWTCPDCGALIRVRRADEVRAAVEHQGADRVAMLSLTVRHGLGDELKRVRQGVAKAWTKLMNGKPWKRFARRIALQGYIRALEVTHGPTHGWHPHVHALLLTHRTLTALELQEAREWLSTRWQDCVERALGDQFRPDDLHGCDLRPCHSADYLAKLGLELTAPGRSKRAKGANRTPMEIAYDVAAEGRGEDGRLWKEYCASMFGARMLTWSRGIRDAVGLDDELTDDELLAAPEAEPREPIALIDGKTWDTIRHVPLVRSRLLEAAEAQGSYGVAAIVNATKASAVH
jgi:hypothetical protein